MPGKRKRYALVYCEGAFDTPNGKTAHGLVRRTERYKVLSVIDSSHAGEDAGFVLEGKPNGVMIYKDLSSAIDSARAEGITPTHFVIGIAPDGGRLDADHHVVLGKAIKAGLHIDSGLHDFFSENKQLQRLASKYNVTLTDVRKPPPRSQLHFFSGKIEEVSSLKIAVLGSDSAVGKRTTCWILKDMLENSGHRTEMIGTGQTAWMQGVRYGIILDSLVNDFVSGEIEHAVWKAWKEQRPDVILIEGQGSMMNPAYPGGFEILAAGRPEAIILQHPPARKDYDGFPGYPLHPLETQIKAIELVSGKPVIAITISHEGLSKEEIPGICKKIQKQTGLPTVDVLIGDIQPVMRALNPLISRTHPE